MTRSPPHSGWITPDQAASAVITMLRLAELYDQRGLWKALIRYVEDSGGSLERLGPGEYFITYKDIP